jgi:hypothetical protein
MNKYKDQNKNNRFYRALMITYHMYHQVSWTFPLPIVYKQKIKHISQTGSLSLGKGWVNMHAVWLDM